MSDSLQDRGKAIENMFFREQDEKLLEKLREEMAASDLREALAKASGITDEGTLEALVSHNVTPESVTAISLVPLIAVAWADNKMEDSEVAAIMKASVDAGVEEDTASHGLLQSWLIDKPGDDLLEAWKTYVNALRSSLEPPAFNQLGNAIMQRAEEVSKAAGGFLGLGSVSDVERLVLDDLHKVFS